MNLNRTSRRFVAGRSRLLTAAVVCLALFTPCVVAHAQHPGGGGGGGGHSMGGSPMGAPPMAMSGSSRERMESRNDLGARGFSESHARPRMGLQLGLGGRWWDDHHTAHQLKLSSDQQHRMDSIFESSEPTLTNLLSNYQRQEIDLASLSPSDLKDESKVFAAIDRVSHARNDLEKGYAHVFLQVRQQLTPEQLEALDRQIANTH
ncbi:MAG: periplasmic heavy metal sensor [Acidobacteriaceae bacterium]